MSRFRIVHRGRAASSSTTYDTAIGNGVDSSGFASLPLYSGGTDGSDLASGAPTSTGASITYTSGTRTLSGTASATGLLGRWNGILTVGVQYRIQFALHLNTGYPFVKLYDQSGTLQATLFIDSNGSALDTMVDVLFTATGTDLVLKEGGDDAFSGSISMSKVATSTGLSARRYYVNSSTGSDSNTGAQAMNPATPLATIDQARKFVTTGFGDQILIAEGTTYSASLPSLTKNGRSAVYPFVIQSYDPADPTNEAKLGRASGGNRPVLNTGATTATLVGQPSYFVIRGLDFSPGNISGPDITFQSSGSVGSNYILLENNILRYTSLTIEQASVTGLSSKYIVRNNSIIAPWVSTGAHQQGVYANKTDGLTIEDNVFYHIGWKIGMSRDDDPSVGGLFGQGIYDHPVYIQNTCSNTIYRRNLVIDGPADGGHVLGANVTMTENVVIDTPIGLCPSDNTGGNITYPSGTTQNIGYNFIIGCNDIDSSSNPRGIGIDVNNQNASSEVHHNVIVQVQNISGSNRCAISAASVGNTTFLNYHDNISYLQNPSGNTKNISVAGGGSVTTTYTNNIWDDPTSGTNTNVGSVTFPNAYTTTGLITAAGYADKQALIDYAIEHPEAHPQRPIYNLGAAGYGMNHTI